VDRAVSFRRWLGRRRSMFSANLVSPPKNITSDLSSSTPQDLSLCWRSA